MFHKKKKHQILHSVHILSFTFTFECKYAHLAIKLLSILYWKAEGERVFSDMNLFKSKIINRIHSVNALIHIKNGLKREQSCCEKYQIPDEVNILNNSFWSDESDDEGTIDFNISMWYFKSKL